jgi:hypothetical protein
LVCRFRPVLIRRKTISAIFDGRYLEFGKRDRAETRWAYVGTRELPENGVEKFFGAVGESATQLNFLYFKGYGHQIRVEGSCDFRATFCYVRFFVSAAVRRKSAKRRFFGSFSAADISAFGSRIGAKFWIRGRKNTAHLLAMSKKFCRLERPTRRIADDDAVRIFLYFARS